MRSGTALSYADGDRGHEDADRDGEPRPTLRMHPSGCVLQRLPTCPCTADLGKHVRAVQILNPRCAYLSPRCRGDAPDAHPCGACVRACITACMATHR